MLNLRQKIKISLNKSKFTQQKQKQWKTIYKTDKKWLWQNPFFDEIFKTQSTFLKRKQF